MKNVIRRINRITGEMKNRIGNVISRMHSFADFYET